MSSADPQEVYSVLSGYKLCVVSTIDDQSRPQAAIVGYTVSRQLEMLFGTSRRTRKYTNLQQHKAVAVTVGDFKAEVQYEGTARQLAAAEVDDSLVKRFGKLPGSDEYINDPDQRWFVVTPNWLRLTVHEEPNRIVEMTEFA